MSKSIEANYMRSKFIKGGYKDIPFDFYDTPEAFINTVLDPLNATHAQVGGFTYSAKNNGDFTVTFTVRNQLSMHSFFYHIPGVPHKERGGFFPFMGNLNQVFEWTERYNKWE